MIAQFFGVFAGRVPKWHDQRCRFWDIFVVTTCRVVIFHPAVAEATPKLMLQVINASNWNETVKNKCSNHIKVQCGAYFDNQAKVLESLPTDDNAGGRRFDPNKSWMVDAILGSPRYKASGAPLVS